MVLVFFFFHRAQEKLMDVLSGHPEGSAVKGQSLSRYFTDWQREANTCTDTSRYHLYQEC